MIVICDYTWGLFLSRISLDTTVCPLYYGKVPLSSYHINKVNVLARCCPTSLPFEIKRVPAAKCDGESVRGIRSFIKGVTARCFVVNESLQLCQIFPDDELYELPASTIYQTFL